MRRKIVAGNWKLHGTRDFANRLVGEVAAEQPDGVDVVILPPLPYLGELIDRFRDSRVLFGAQDVSSNEKGAYTGEVSAAMLVDVGAVFGLVGHSERRQYHLESSELVARKFRAALNAGLRPILCVGETLEQREAGATESVLASQLHPVLDHAGAEGFAQAVVAYEPVWAIGTGRTASPDQAQACTPSSVAWWPRAMLESPVSCRSSTAAASSPTTRPSYSRSRMSTADWSAAPRWWPATSWPSRAPRRPDRSSGSKRKRTTTMLMSILNVIYVLVAIAMIALILMQRGAGAAAGSGFGAGASGTVFGSRGASNFLSKSTKWLAVAFFGISLFMAWYASHNARPAASAGLGVMSAATVPAAPAASSEVPAAEKNPPAPTTGN